MTDTYERVIAATTDTPLYESHYLKANAPDGSGALWLKHNVLRPRPELGAPAVAEFWLVLWGPDRRPRAYKRVVALDRVELGRDRVSYRTDDLVFDPTRAEGRIGEVSWQLALRDELPPLRHLPEDWMYRARFPRKKLVTGSPRLVLSGTVRTPDGTVDVTGWVGHRNHNWGSEHAFRYAYGACNVWEDGADLTVEGFTVQVRLVGPLRSPWLTMIVGLDSGRWFGPDDLAGVLRSRGRVAWPRWVATGPGPTTVRMVADPATVVGLRYLHPDGQVSYCYNTKFAEVEARIGGVSHRSGAGELEFLFPGPIPGIPLHGEGSLEELAAAGRMSERG